MPPRRDGGNSRYNRNANRTYGYSPGDRAGGSDTDGLSREVALNLNEIVASLDGVGQFPVRSDCQLVSLQ
jgi:hypothetical protein